MANYYVGYVGVGFGNIKTSLPRNADGLPALLESKNKNIMTDEFAEHFQVLGPLALML